MIYINNYILQNNELFNLRQQNERQDQNEIAVIHFCPYFIKKCIFEEL